MGPPDDVLPGIAVLELALVHTDRQVMWIAAAEVYPEGMAFSVLMSGRRAARQGVEAGSGTWRFGGQFSDGRKATVYGVGMFSGVGGVLGGAGGIGRLPAVVSTVSATGGARAVGKAGGGAESAPDGPVLRARGGGGSRSAWRQEYWLWPLPPPGEMLFACEWPDLKIEFSTATISADLLHQAATRARPMWPDQDPPNQ